MLKKKKKFLNLAMIYVCYSLLDTLRLKFLQHVKQNIIEF